MKGLPGAPAKPTKREKSKPRPIKRSKPPARVRQTKAGKESESLDRLFSRYIRLRDPGCDIGYVCGFRRLSTDAAHLLGVGSHPRIKWEKNNAVGACRSCHRFMTDHPNMWMAWVIKTFGSALFTRLHDLSQAGPKPDREAIRADLLKDIKELES